MSKPSNDFVRARCAVNGCGLVYVFSVAFKGAEVKRLMPRMLAAAGWLSIGEENYCNLCSEAMRSTLSRMTGDMARSVRSAISDSLYLRRMETVGMDR
jgi:hypothetical protein